MATSKSPIFVAIRVRPFVSREASHDRCVDVSHAGEGAMIRVSGSQGSHFSFAVDAAFDDGCDKVRVSKKAQQDRVYDVVGSRLLERALQGFHVAVFAYGHTGTGKTTTMFGEPSSEGLAPRLLRDLFAHRNELETPGHQVNFRLRMCEIHNERLRDLLALVHHIPAMARSRAGPDIASTVHSTTAQTRRRAISPDIASTVPSSTAQTRSRASCPDISSTIPFTTAQTRSRASLETLSMVEETSTPKQRRQSLRESLDVNFHPKFGVYVPGLSEVPVASAEEACNLLHLGAAARESAGTALNTQSSRGHVIFTVIVEENSNQQCRIISELSCVDLAGRENEKTTAVTGDQLVELSFINRSLFHLSNCINGLQRSCSKESNDSRGCSPKQGREGVRNSMAQFRNSKLTMLLSQAISGNSCTAMVGTLSPALGSRDETLGTLRFAAVVRGIRLEATKSSQKESLDQREKAALQREIQELRSQLQNYKAEADAKAAQEIRPELLTSQALCNRLHKESDECRQAARKVSKESALALQRLIDLQKMSSPPVGGFSVAGSINGKRAKALVQDANLLLSLCKKNAGLTFGVVELPSCSAPAGTSAMETFVQLYQVDYNAGPGSPPRVLNVWTVEDFDVLTEQMKREHRTSAFDFDFRSKILMFRCLEQYICFDTPKNSPTPYSKEFTNSPKNSQSSTLTTMSPTPSSCAPSSDLSSPLITPRSGSSMSTSASSKNFHFFRVQPEASLSSSTLSEVQKLVQGKGSKISEAQKLVHGKASKVESLQSKLTKLEDWNFPEAAGFQAVFQDQYPPPALPRESSPAREEEIDDFKPKEGLLRVKLGSLLKDNASLTEEFDALMRAMRALNDGHAVLLVPESQ